jgi:hypothetical protein
MSVLPARAAVGRVISAWAALAGGDLVAARRLADEAGLDHDRLVPVDGADRACPGGERGG